jgi:CBS domain-containing protein
VSEAVELMREYAIRRLPVIAADGQPQGVVTIGDLAVSEDPQSALADISAAPPNK